MLKKECIAMLLAGGQGSRLNSLTKNIAKPAVSFGGKYRIIDFGLSNCINSGIDTVGVLTQYRPLVLNHYIGTGQAWDLDVSTGGIHILPPYATEEGGSWYEGTADAIYRNIDFIDSYNPAHVLILSGDHLYKMNYKLMLAEHKAKNADLTVSVIEVPWEEASRFGIMSTDADGYITRFAEKPKNPESNLASMGIYIFSWPILKAALIADHEDATSDKDFGKNIIPRLLGEGKRLCSYRFDSYWKDVGTVESYYEAQMELLQEKPPFDIFDEDWHIFSNSNLYPPHLIGATGSVKGSSLICNGSIVNGTVENSIIGSGAVIEEGAVIKDSILLPDSYVGKNCVLKRAIVNEFTRVKADCVVESEEITLISSNSEYAEKGVH